MCVDQESLVIFPPTSVSRQVVLGGVGGEGIGVLVVGVFAAVVGSGLPREGDAGVVVGVDGLAEVDGVFQLLFQHLLARVSGQLQQEEAGVGLWQEVVGRVVLVQHLRTEEELTDSAWQPHWHSHLCCTGPPLTANFTHIYF